MASRSRQLREQLERGTVVLPGAFNAITARLIERAGFEACYISGAGLANSAGLPDVGLLTLTEVAAQAQLICQAVSLPCVCDADTGFGEGGNVARTVREFERAGLSGLHLEDQEFPKKCGHLEGKKLITVESMEDKIRSATGARKDPDFLIIARTDARAVEGMEAAIDRGRRYLAAGADALFPEAMESRDDFVKFAGGVSGGGGATPWLMANMTEFGKTPYLTVDEFAALGYRMVIFPLTAFRAMLKAVASTVEELKRAGTQKDLLDRMMTRKELYELLEYEDTGGR